MLPGGDASGEPYGHREAACRRSEAALSGAGETDEHGPEPARTPPWRGARAARAANQQVEPCSGSRRTPVRSARPWGAVAAAARPSHTFGRHFGSRTTGAAPASCPPAGSATRKPPRGPRRRQVRRTACAARPVRGRNSPEPAGGAYRPAVTPPLAQALRRRCRSTEGAPPRSVADVEESMPVKSTSSPCAPSAVLEADLLESFWPRCPGAAARRRRRGLRLAHPVRADPHHPVPRFPDRLLTREPGRARRRSRRSVRHRAAWRAGRPRPRRRPRCG